MTARTKRREWTVASWLLAGVDAEAAHPALAAIEADVILVQSTRERTVNDLAAALGFHSVWSRSHHPRSRLIPRSAVGLAVMTPHTIATTHTEVISSTASLWSPKRRIAQTVRVDRADHSGYRFVQAVASMPAELVAQDSYPTVLVRPSAAEAQPPEVFVLPAIAEVVRTEASRPVDGKAPLVMTTFALDWVVGDFAW